jgi:phosphoglycolate phosphatase
MVKLIIFDWDDVFTLGSKDGYYKCYHNALKGVGVSLDPAEEDLRIKEKWGAGHEAQLAWLLREHPELIQRAVEIYQEHLFGSTFVDCLTIIKGAQEFLVDISKRYKLAIATGSHPKILVGRVFPNFHIPDVFAKIITIYDLDDPALTKPHPFMLNSIMKEVGSKPEETVLVGDATSDMQMAWSAGIEPIAVLTGHMNRQEAALIGVKHIIQNVIKLEPELELINKHKSFIRSSG